MRLRGVVGASASAVTACAFAGFAIAAEPYAGKPRIDDDGTVHVPAYELPFFSLASPEARALTILKLRTPPAKLPPNPTIADLRKAKADGTDARRLVAMTAKYKFDLVEQRIGKVLTQVFTPKAGIAPKNRERVLVNMHGWGFNTGAMTTSQAESIPFAVIGQIKVVSIDYRMAPEAHYPAASQDVAAVYRELLKTYKPSSIAFYGCSAGGHLTAQSMAWFQTHGLPTPAAAGVFSSGVGFIKGGDSLRVTSRMGSVLPDENPAAPPSTSPMDYFLGADRKDSALDPLASPAVLAKFPPTILMTGTRAGDLSKVIWSHRALVKAGVDARMVLWDGVDHCFISEGELPESREAVEIAVRFFDDAMDKAAR